MSLPESDLDLIVSELGREPTPAESVLFENLWSEHCAYRSSRPLLSAFDSEGDAVVIGPGDDAAVVAVPLSEHANTPAAKRSPDEYSETYITLGIESHNHPSYVDPYDGAATGVGGIVRDTMSMGAYPIALTDSIYFGPFAREHSKYLFDGVVEGIADYGNSIGVPTVGGSVEFHEGYVGNPLVNVACVGLTDANRLVTAEAQSAGNRLVLVGNATGRDGLGGASFASEDLSEDAETEDRPAVQVGDPYTEKLLIEANEALIDESLVESARDLGAAGLGGASSELVGKGGFGARIELDRVHQREPNMKALEILLAESQERMCYEVRPENVDRVAEIADRFDLGCSVIGEVTEGNYVCTFDGEVVVDVDSDFLTEGAPMNNLDAEAPAEPTVAVPDIGLVEAFEAVVSAPSAASKEWVYRQYDHEVGTRTAVKPGDDAAVMAIRETTGDTMDTSGDGTGLAISAGAVPNWTAAAPYEGARAVALENATNLAAKGALPLAAVDCLNGGNPEKPTVYGSFKAIVDGLADMCSALSTPVVGGNVSLYNDSATGPIPPTPTLAMVGARSGYDAPPAALAGEGELLVIGETGDRLGGSTYLAEFNGSDRFPTLPDDPAAVIESIARVASLDSTLATHDVSTGGLAVTLAELVTETAGAAVTLESIAAAFDETPGRIVVETTDTDAVRNAVANGVPVRSLGQATTDGELALSVGDDSRTYDYEAISALRSTIDSAFE
ncbi:phosphoribosylformylglycinamidine synthase subunit PurL [Halalkalirubrum salinum]|uniref:phosphoribosylformylglycinamidine synthase subunit PurL n=1 Tax=Halalkalirubrum salinum TaxID=2563889 RepID=UPI0010FB1B50|nr:phosphoribosylformylglycinamidine synthase subunit PurL [Halalkalirubrum salinum]